MLVDIQHEVGVFLAVVIVAVAIMSFLSLGKLLVGSGVNLAFEEHMRIVHAEACGGVQPVGNLVGQPHVEHVAALLVGSHIAVGSPVRVLRSVGRFGHRPVLYGKLTAVIITLKSLDVFKVFSPREEVGSHHRIPVLSLRHHVAVFLLHIRRAQVELQFILEEGGSVADSEVQTVVRVIGHNTGRVGG